MRGIVVVAFLCLLSFVYDDAGRVFILPVGVSSSTGKTHSFDATLQKNTNLFLFLFLFLFFCVNHNRSIDVKKMSKNVHTKALLPLCKKKMCVKKKKVTKKSHTKTFSINQSSGLLTYLIPRRRRTNRGAL